MLLRTKPEGLATSCVCVGVGGAGVEEKYFFFFEKYFSMAKLVCQYPA